MTHLYFSSYLLLALAAICFAAKAASSPSDPIAPKRFGSSQTKITDSEHDILIAREDAASAHLHGDIVARAAVFLGSSITGSTNVGAQSTTVANSSATSFKISHTPSLSYSSGKFAITINSTAVNFNTAKGQFPSNGTAAASSMSSSTAVAILDDVSSSPSMSNISSNTAVALLNDVFNFPTISTISSSPAVASLHDDSVPPTVSNRTSSILNVARLTNATLFKLSPVTTSGVAGTQVYRVTTGESSPSRSSHASQVSSSGLPTVVTATIDPTNSAALADGIALGGALLLFSKSAAQVGPDIVKPSIKTDTLNSLEKIESDLENAFKDRGGVDIEAPCVAKRKRFRLKNRDLISQLLNDFRCAIDSVNALKTHLSVENPDPTVIDDDLEAVGTRGQELKTDETDDDDDDDDKTATKKETTTTSETVTKSNPTSQQTTAILTTSSSISKSSASRTATISSGQVSNATCYTGPEYLFPASATASVPAKSQSEASQLASFALSKFFAMDPPVPFTSLPSSTIDISCPNATPVPGQCGLAQCVYEIVADQEILPAGTENYCFCAGGPDVAAATAPLLTHSPISSGASSTTDCAYTVQPAPGWTPSITMTSVPTVTPPSPAISSSIIPSAALSDCTVACTESSAAAFDE